MVSSARGFVRRSGKDSGQNLCVCFAVLSFGDVPVWRAVQGMRRGLRGRTAIAGVLFGVRVAKGVWCPRLGGDCLFFPCFLHTQNGALRHVCDVA